MVRFKQQRKGAIKMIKAGVGTSTGGAYVEMEFLTLDTPRGVITHQATYDLLLEREDSVERMEMDRDELTAFRDELNRLLSIKP